MSSRVRKDKSLDAMIFMIRLPLLKDELAFLEKHLPQLESRADLGQLATEFKTQIAQIRQEISALERDQHSK